MRPFFWASLTNVQTNGLENIHNFTLKNYAYLDLWFLQNATRYTFLLLILKVHVIIIYDMNQCSL